MPRALARKFTSMQEITPKVVGNRAATSVHFMLPVSFFTVMSDVEQGQCISENSSTHIAVTGVHPFDIKSVLRASAPSSVRVPPAVYAIIIMGTTISFLPFRFHAAK